MERDDTDEGLLDPTCCLAEGATPTGLVNESLPVSAVAVLSRCERVPEEENTVCAVLHNWTLLI